MRLLGLIVVAGALGGICSTSDVLAITESVDVTKMTQIDEATPNTNDGGGTIACVAKTGGTEILILLSFPWDEDTIPGENGVDYEIDGAHLYVYLWDVYNSPRVEVQPIDGPARCQWSEHAVTWNGFDHSCIFYDIDDRLLLPSQEGGYVYWNIETAIEWWDSGEANNGLALVMESGETNDVACFFTDDTSPAPYVEVNYHWRGVAAPTNCTVSEPDPDAEHPWVLITWDDNADNETKYEILRQDINSYPYWGVRILDPNSTSYLNDDTSGTWAVVNHNHLNCDYVGYGYCEGDYKYRVCAWNSVPDPSVSSGEVDCTPYPNVPTTPPTWGTLKLMYR